MSWSSARSPFGLVNCTTEINRRNSSTARPARLQSSSRTVRRTSTGPTQNSAGCTLTPSPQQPTDLTSPQRAAHTSVESRREPPARKRAGRPFEHARSATAAAKPTDIGNSGTRPGTRSGTRAETARRRMVVEDLWKAGLSVRAISGGTGIPVGSVHRAMRAIARAEAKKQVATAEIANALLGKTLSHRRGGRT
jgi:hypothetical protein